MRQHDGFPCPVRLIPILGLLFVTLLLAGCVSKDYYKLSINYALPGATLPLYPGLAECVKDHWASDNLRFTLTSSDGSVLFEQEFTRE